MILAVTLLTAAHVLQTLPQLTRGELDLDESSTFLVSTRPFRDVLVVPTTFQAQPPLFYLALGGVTRWATSERALRLLPWVFLLAGGVTLLAADSGLSPLARIVAVAVLWLSDFSRYLAVEVRPYSLAAWLSWWSCLLLWQLLEFPTRRRAIAYVAVTTLMAYSLAVAAWIIVAEGLALAAIAWLDANPDSAFGGTARLRRAFARVSLPLMALACVVILWLPYVIAAERFHGNVGQPSLVAALRDGLNPRYYVSGPIYLTKAAYGLGYAALVMAAAAVWDGLRRRDRFVAFLVLVVAVQIGLTHGFVAGRSAFAFRYLSPAYPALCALVGIGAAGLFERFRWASWLVLAGSIVVGTASGTVFLRTQGREPVGPWRLLRAELLRLPGPKILFFDVGWDGQRLQYELRHDADVRVMTDPGTGWATQGRQMTPEYVERVIHDTASTTRMYFYQYDPAWRSSVFQSAFAPAMSRLGCERTYERAVPTYVRDVPDDRAGAVVVGYTCHVG